MRNCPTLAGEITTTNTFDTVSGGTEVTVLQEGRPEAIEVTDAEAGWADSLGKLASVLEERSVSSAEGSKRKTVSDGGSTAKDDYSGYPNPALPPRSLRRYSDHNVS